MRASLTGAPLLLYFERGQKMTNTEKLLAANLVGEAIIIGLIIR